MISEPAPDLDAFREAGDPATSAARLWELVQHPELAATVAANPAAPAELLRELGARLAEGSSLPAMQAIALMTHGRPATATAHLQELGIRGDDPVLAAVAANPNTPVDTLVRLAGPFPAQFCSNPIFPLLLLENPNLPGEIPVAIARSLLRYAGVPKMFLDWLVAYGLHEVAAAARLHVNIAGEAGDDWEALAEAEIWRAGVSEGGDLLLELLGLGAAPTWMLLPIAAGGDRAVRAAVAGGPATPRAVLKVLRRAGASSTLSGYAPPDLALAPEQLSWLAAGGAYARRVAARHPSTPVATLDILAADSDRGVRAGVARNPAASPAQLERLAADTEADVRQQAARNPATTPQALQRLAADLSKDVRWTVARNPRTPLTALEMLACDAHPVVRQGVARSSAAPPALLATLALDPHAAVRLAVARAAGTPTDTLLRLANDTQPAVRAAVARHPATPASLRSQLLPQSEATQTGSHQSFAQSCSAAPSAAPAADVARHLDPAVRAAAAAHSDAPAALLRLLAEDDDLRVRAAVGGNSHTPLDRIEWLADDESLIVHRAVAANPATPIGLLARFAADYTYSNMRVRLAVVGNPNVSAALLEHLAGDLTVEVRRAVMRHPLTPAGARSRILASSLDMCTRSSETLYHVLALANPAAPAGYLAAHVGSSEWLERFAIARNPAAARPVLESLAEDGNRLVRAAARAALEKL